MLLVLHCPVIPELNTFLMETVELTPAHLTHRPIKPVLLGVVDSRPRIYQMEVVGLTLVQPRLLARFQE